MAKHIFKMVWNRKRANSLVILEIFISFLVVFGVVATATQLLSYYRMPLGFDYNDLWDVGIDTGQAFFDGPPPDMGETVERLRTELLAHDEVRGVAVSVFEPYLSGRSTMDWAGQEGRPRVDTELMRVSPSYLDVLGLHLVAGRWFEPADEHVHWIPTVVSVELAEDAFGDEDPIGKVVVENDEDEGTSDEYRVIGVVSTFRRMGEFRPPHNVLFRPMWPTSEILFPRRHLQVKLAPGTTAAFEETLMKTLRGVAPGWSFDLQSVEASRERYLRAQLAPLFVISLVAVFLMLMVGLGLMGVLWQNVTQRTRELGLRRAKGATQHNIYHQILGELLTIAGLGIALGMVVVAQVPVLDVVELEGRVFVLSLGLSVLVLLGLTALCGLYPSWLATRVQPAQALHYE